MTVRVEVNDAELAALASDWSNGIGAFIAERTAEVAATARALAPVSDRGSKYAPPGYLKSRVNTARQHAPDGTILGLVGVPLASGSRYPLPFVANPKGATRNRNGRGTRPAANYFLLRALAAVMGSA